VCWCVGVLVCWCVGVLVYWRVGVLVCWYVGVDVDWIYWITKGSCPQKVHGGHGTWDVIITNPPLFYYGTGGEPQTCDLLAFSVCFLFPLLSSLFSLLSSFFSLLPHSHSHSSFCSIPWSTYFFGKQPLSSVRILMMTHFLTLSPSFFNHHFEHFLFNKILIQFI